MKSIWLISYHLDGVTAGPAIRFQRYAPLFLEKGYRLTIVTRLISNDLPKKESREHFDVIRIASSSKYLHHSVFINRALKLALKNRNDIDAVLTFSITTLSLLLIPAFKANKLKLFFVNTMALEYSYTKSNAFWASLYDNYFFGLYSLLYRHITGIVGSSSLLVNRFLKHNILEDKLHVIYNGVNTTKFAPTQEEQKKMIRENLGVPKNDFLFLFVGLKTERKGLKELLEAWENWKERGDSKLILVGAEKPSANSHEFNAFWESYKDSEREDVILFGNRRDIDQFFKACDCFVFLSKKEGMPNVLLEAMASGLPIITNKFQGFSEDYGEPGKEYLLVIDNNIPSIITSLDSVYKNSNKRELLGGNARKHALDQFDVDVSINKYCEIVEG